MLSSLKGKWRHAREKSKLKQAKLFKAPDGVIMAAQIRDPETGCSASICSNCFAKIAFCDTTCDSCGYELINAHGMPDVETWRAHITKFKQTALTVGFHRMVEAIKKHTHDWRGISDSPLNRYGK